MRQHRMIGTEGELKCGLPGTIAQVDGNTVDRPFYAAMALCCSPMAMEPDYRNPVRALFMAPARLDLRRRLPVPVNSWKRRRASICAASIGPLCLRRLRFAIFRACGDAQKKPGS